MSVYTFPVKIRSNSTKGAAWNIWHIGTTDSSVPSSGGLTEMSTAIQGFYTALRDQLPDNGIWSYAADAVTITGTPEVDTSAPAWSVGGNSNALVLPSANAVCITWRTANATRSGRGRTFVSPVLSTIAEQDGSITPAGLTLFRDAAAQLVTNSNASTDGSIGVWSQKNAALYTITGGTVSDKFAVLRSRRD